MKPTIFSLLLLISATLKAEELHWYQVFIQKNDTPQESVIGTSPLNLSEITKDISTGSKFLILNNLRLWTANNWIISPEARNQSISINSSFITYFYEIEADPIKNKVQQGAAANP